MTAGRIDTEARKVVTVLFSDISGSTGLGEALDPESLQQLLSRYFAEMKLVVERHEGLVSKFIGDAVMAVFGLPRAHEDDALRAVRAAAEMRAALAALNAELAASFGVTVAARTGVNTGEVLAREPGGGEALVVGDAVNTAARLEQVAAPGEILVGEETHRLIHDAVRAEPVGPLELRGKGAAVRAWRVTEVVADAPGRTRRLDSPLVGRAGELERLEDAFRRVAASRTCELVTVVGPAGVGKSRLTEELLSRIGARATIVQGRCLPYGDGITFWPLVSVLMGAVGISERDSDREARRKLAAALADAGEAGADDALVCDALVPLLGFGAGAAGLQETYWAVRKLLERLGARRPLVVVFDDIHWGEATFHDLLDYLADRLDAAAVLLLCQARRELLDARPGWMTGKPNASVVTLQPLSDAQTDILIGELVAGAQLPPAARGRIAAMAEGNPLFVEETLRMLVDRGVLRSQDGRWTVAGDLSQIAIPPTIQALLTARLDALPAAQRGVIERGAVVGRSFWWGAVADLSPPDLRPRIAACLQSLVRKELIEPDRSEIPHEDAFRFAHILIRDAAYRGIPKAVRAEMHERLADWLAARTPELAGEYEEIIGYHLEQAHRCLAELGPPTPRTRALAARAAGPLAAAGRRAFARGDMPAALSLLSRATALLPHRDPRRLELLPDVAFALMETADFDRLLGVAREMDAAVADTGDVGVQAHAIVVALWIRLFTDPAEWAAEAEREGRRAIAAFTDLGDERGLARAWSLLGLVHGMYARFAAAEDAWSRAAEHAQRAGNRREALEALSWVPLMVWAGPTPAEEGIRRCRATFERVQPDKKAMSSALFAQAGLEAGLGRFAAARELLARARVLADEVALPVWTAGPLAQYAGWTELLAGDPAAAERELRPALRTLRAIGEVSWLSTVAAILAEAMHGQGDDEEAARLTRLSERSAGAEDVYSHVLWRSVRAKVLARGGDTAGALRLARAAAELAADSDFLHLRWHEALSRAEVLALAGRAAEAEAAAREALGFAERKGSAVGARLARAALADLPAPVAGPGSRREPAGS